MTYTGPMARTVYLASEMGWMLTTGFDKDEPNTVQEALSGPQQQQCKAAMVDGTLRRWNWGSGKVLTQFARYAGVPASGATSEALQTILLVRDISSGALSQWVHAAGVLQSFTAWGSSEVNGYAKGSAACPPEGPLRGRRAAAVDIPPRRRSQRVLQVVQVNHCYC